MALSQPPTPAGSDPQRARPTWIERRQQKVREEIARNRRGEYTVPTWVLALTLALIVGGWVALVALA
jgi:hypothetical protein